MNATTTERTEEDIAMGIAKVSERLRKEEGWVLQFETALREEEARVGPQEYGGAPNALLFVFSSGLEDSKKLVASLRARLEELERRAISLR